MGKPTIHQQHQAIARRFSPSLRPWVAALLAVDGTGRLAQLAKTCPGALIFAHALLKHERARATAAGLALLRDAVAGRRLNDLLDTALLAWADGANRMVALWRRLRYPGRGIWHRVAEAEGASLKRLLRAKRLLIHRAGAQASEQVLWYPSPVAFSPEDIPADPQDNAAWFAAVIWHDHDAVERKGGVSRRSRGMAAFVSRNALASKLADLRRGGAWRPRSILSYAAATGDYPRRQTPVSPYVGKVEAWHRKIEKVVRAGPGMQRVGRPLVGNDVRDRPLPRSPCPGWRTGDDRVVPIRTVAELVAESMRMRNHAAGFIDEALAGLVAVYHADVAGKGLTVRVTPEGRGYRLEYVIGFDDAKPTRAQNRVLHEFAAHLRVGARCGCTPARAG